MRQALGVILLFVLGSVQASAANYITVLEDNRYVRVDGYTFDNYGPKEYFDDSYFPVESGVDFSRESFAGGDAQNSSLQAGDSGNDMAATAEVYSDQSDLGITGYLVQENSVFDITFVANAGFNYELNFSGTLLNSQFALYSGAEIDNLNQIFSTNSDFSFDSTLMGGQTYRLVATAETIDLPSSQASFNFEGTLLNSTVVPIPAAVWLFGSALAGLGWFRRKKA